MKLGNVCNVLNGFAFRSEKYVDEGIRIIRISNVQKGYIEDTTPEFNPRNSEEAIKYELECGDILISLTGNVGRVAIITTEFLPAALNQRVACLRIKNEIQLDKSFLFNYLNSDRFEQQCIMSSKGVAQKNMSTEWLKEYEMPDLTIKQQKEISQILSELSTLILCGKRQLARLDELVKSRFVEMFGFPGIDVYGWGMSSLGEICEINPKKSQDARLTSGLLVSFVPMPSVSESGDIDATQVKPYDEVKTGFTYFAENDVLFAKITPCMENGKGAVAIGLRNGIGFGSTEFHVLRPKKGMTTPCWIYTLTVFPQFRIDAASNMTGSAGQRRVPASFLENYRVSVPPLELQNRFAAFVSEVDKSKLAVKQSLEKLETLKKSLMQQYFG